MRAKVLNPGEPRVIAVVFETGEDPVAALTEFAADHSLGAASLAAIGAFSEATLGYFDWEKKDYDRIEIREQVEVLSLIGDTALEGERMRLLHELEQAGSGLENSSRTIDFTTVVPSYE